MTNRKPRGWNLIGCHYDSLRVAFSYKVSFTLFGFAQLTKPDLVKESSVAAFLRRKHHERSMVSGGSLFGQTASFRPRRANIQSSGSSQRQEVLIYTFITSIGEGDFQRGYYEIYTSDDNKVFKQYMNVATGQGVNIVNSANLWVPMPADKVLRVKLHHPTSPTSEKKHIAGKLAARQDWSDVFVIGFRT